MTVVHTVAFLASDHGCLKFASQNGMDAFMEGVGVSMERGLTYGALAFCVVKDMYISSHTLLNSTTFVLLQAPLQGTLR